MTSNHAASVVTPHTCRRSHRGIVRIALAAAGAFGMLAAAIQPAAAQSAPSAPKAHTGWNFLVSSGTLVPTGVQRHAIKRSNLTTAQLSYVVHPSLAVMTTLGWARSRDVASVNDPKLDVFTYDLGAEVRAPRWLAGDVMSFSPFAGVGAGVRSYNYRSLEIDATHNLAAYASAGGEIGIGRVHLRIEARDYVTGFKPLDGVGAADTRNDVVLVAGLRF